MNLEQLFAIRNLKSTIRNEMGEMPCKGLDSRLQACLGHLAGKQKRARGQCRVWAGLICSKPSYKLEGRMDADRCKGKEAQRSSEGNSVPAIQNEQKQETSEKHSLDNKHKGWLKSI
ncbi:MAG: hypothetical protein NTX75_15365 [Proteobacteria bacterium]|nr:hypothetical protein [Pseudomonadota bacterium]